LFRALDDADFAAFRRALKYWNEQEREAISELQPTEGDVQPSFHHPLLVSALCLFCRSSDSLRLTPFEYTLRLLAKWAVLRDHCNRTGASLPFASMYAPRDAMRVLEMAMLFMLDHGALDATGIPEEDECLQTWQRSEGGLVSSSSASSPSSSSPCSVSPQSAKYVYLFEGVSSLVQPLLYPQSLMPQTLDQTSACDTCHKVCEYPIHQMVRLRLVSVLRRSLTSSLVKSADILDDSNLTPLHVALECVLKSTDDSKVLEQYVDIARLLLEHGANPNVGVGTAEGTPLFWFCKKRLEIGEQSLGERALRQRRARVFDTFPCSLQPSHKDIVDLMLWYGADLDATNHEHLTVWDVLRLESEPRLVSFVKLRMEDMYARFTTLRFGWNLQEHEGNFLPNSSGELMGLRLIDLTDDLLLHIFQYLDNPKDKYLHLGNVCRRFYVLSRHSCLWQKFRLLRRGALGTPAE